MFPKEKNLIEIRRISLQETRCVLKDMVRGSIGRHTSLIEGAILLGNNLKDILHGSKGKRFLEANCIPVEKHIGTYILYF